MIKSRGTLAGMRFSKMQSPAVIVCLSLAFGCENADGDRGESNVANAELSLMAQGANSDPPHHKVDNVTRSVGESSSPGVADGPPEPSADEVIRASYDWSLAPQMVAYGEDAAPYLINKHPRITKRTRLHTREIHRQTAAALGLKARGDEDPKLARFLMTRASIEATEQGNERPLDRRGTVHGLDVSAAWRAGARLRKGYVEAGNDLAKTQPYVWLGYGQGGMNSWLNLNNWDDLGDPRMLADTVIFGLTYARVARKKMRMLHGRISCPVWDDEGRWKTTRYNGKRYRVGKRAIDKEGYDECMATAPEGVEKEEAQDSRCERENKMSYKWKVGGYQPDTTMRVDEIDWWQLKRATNGKPCPPWKGDEYEAKLRQRFKERAARFDLDSTEVVRMRDLGEEPEGIGQYELWMQIWDSAMVALGEPPVNWERLQAYGTEEMYDNTPSPEKLAEQRALERDPLALEKKWVRRSKKEK
jgi:hypothetical protein